LGKEITEMISLKKIKYGFICVIMIVAMAGFSWADGCKATYGNQELIFRLATGSPGELGLLKGFAKVFNAKHNSSMCWVKAGSGKSLKLLYAKKVDVVMVHAPAAEKRAIKDGWAIKRVLIGSNEFYIVGPENDPAGIAKAKSASDAYGKIAQSKSKFLSRGDNSGTNKKELVIWKRAGVKPEGDWYIITKDFMMATLKKADQLEGYFMTDSSTWVAGKKDINNLKVLFRGDPVLINTYHGLCQPEDGSKTQAIASEFIDFLSSEDGQKLIRKYGKSLYGEAMYNDAEYAKKYDH
jgi:tungstate transport system substrate-binding protein